MRGLSKCFDVDGEEARIPARDVAPGGCGIVVPGDDPTGCGRFGEEGLFGRQRLVGEHVVGHIPVGPDMAAGGDQFARVDQGAVAGV